jgi:hypothetical protein
MRLGAGRFEGHGAETGNCCLREPREIIARGLQRSHFDARRHGAGRYRRDQCEIRRALLRLHRALADHGLARSGVCCVHRAIEGRGGNRFAGKAPRERRERKRQKSQHNENGVGAPHGEKLSTRGAHACNYSFPQKANVTAPTRNRNEMAWFHRTRSPR